MFEVNSRYPYLPSYFNIVICYLQDSPVLVISMVCYISCYFYLTLFENIDISLLTLTIGFQLPYYSQSIYSGLDNLESYDRLFVQPYTLLMSAFFQYQYISSISITIHILLYMLWILYIIQILYIYDIHICYPLQYYLFSKYQLIPSLYNE